VDLVRNLAATAALLTLACSGLRSGEGGTDDDFVTASGAGTSRTTTTTTTTVTTASASSSSSSSTGSVADLPADKFDLGIMPDIQADPGCAAWTENTMTVGFSNIWIANSTEGTVSKIDTVSATEIARYVSGPMADPDPSRTSVNLYGDVVVVNRGGGIAKIAARLSDCIDRNDDGQIQTSSGPGDVLPWGDDECVLWHTDLPQSGTNGARPVAWEGTIDEEGCPITHPRLWVGHYNGPILNQGFFYRLDGETGSILDTRTVNEWGQSFDPLTYGPYGGAMDQNGDFWVGGRGDAPVIRIEEANAFITRFDAPFEVSQYGFALDESGRPWIAGCDGHIQTLDPSNGMWTDIGDAGGCLRGLQVDREGRGFIAGNSPCRLVEIDTVSQTIVATDIALPGCLEPVGVSIDVEGYVWIVDRGAQQAYKVDPDTYAVDATVAGLVDPYTYSDMTGAGLNLVVNPPG
jgi:hypothetical protein